MTKEEAIFALEYHKLHFATEKGAEAFDMAIKALAQEPILDKIRAEIDRQQKWLFQAGYTAYNVDIAFDAIKAVVTESEE